MDRPKRRGNTEFAWRAGRPRSRKARLEAASLEGGARSVAEDVGVGAEAEADELELVVDDAVKENQVGFDVAVADAGEFALERVVAEGRRKRTLCAEKPDDVLDFLGVLSPADGALVIAVESGGEDGNEHGGHSSGMASRAANISSTLAKGPYSGSVPASRRSRRWRVSSLGISSLFSGMVPRERVSARRRFMASEVETPSREKRARALRLVSGATRKEMVAVFMAGSGPCVGRIMSGGRGHCKQFARGGTGRVTCFAGGPYALRQNAGGPPAPPGHGKMPHLPKRGWKPHLRKGKRILNVA